MNPTESGSFHLAEALRRPVFHKFRRTTGNIVLRSAPSSSKLRRSPKKISGLQSAARSTNVGTVMSRTTRVDAHILAATSPTSKTGWVCGSVQTFAAEVFSHYTNRASCISGSEVGHLLKQWRSMNTAKIRAQLRQTSQCATRSRRPKPSIARAEPLT